MHEFLESSYDALVGTIYESARDPLLLKSALGATVRAVDARAGTLGIIDRRQGNPVMSISFGTTPIADFDYLERYGRMDPRVEFGMRAAVGEWIQCHTYLSPAFVDRSAFYQEFLIPYGFRWNCGARIFDTENHIGFIGLHSAVDQSPIGSDGLQLLERLTPHWQRSLELQRGAIALLDQWTMIRSLLNSMGYATLVCNVDGVVIVANDAALELLRAGDGLALNSDRLRFPDAGLQRRFANLLALSGSLANAPDGKPANGPDAAMLVPRPSGRAAYQLILRKLHTDRTLLSLRNGDSFVLTVSDPASVTVPHLRAVTLMYELTPAESRLAECLLMGATLDAAASALGTKLQTVRTQLKGLFAKTQTHRQSELLVLLKSAISVR